MKKTPTIIKASVYITLFFLTVNLKSQNPQWINYFDTLSNGDVFNGICLSIDNLDNKWLGGIGYNQGIAKFDNNSWVNYNSSTTSISIGNVTNISIDNKNIKWFGTADHGLIKYDNSNWTVYKNTNSGFPLYNLFCMFDNKWNLWMEAGEASGPHGMLKFDGNNWAIYDSSNSCYNMWWNRFIIDNENNIWICMNNTLIKFNVNNCTTYSASGIISSEDNLSCISADKIGNIWLGTGESGLVKFDGTNWTVYRHSNPGIPDYPMWCITTDSQGNKWIGTETKGLVKFDGTNWYEFNDLNSGFYGNDVSSIAIDKYNNKWITGIQESLSVFNENGVSFASINELEKIDKIINIYPNPIDKQLVINFQQSTNKQISLSMFDATGRVVYSSPVIHKQINTSNLNDGVYVLRMVGDSFVETRKVVVKH